MSRYQNAVAVEKRVYKNLKLFMDDKKEGDHLFNQLKTTILNQYLNSLMDGLTAKVSCTQLGSSISMNLELRLRIFSP